MGEDGEKTEDKDTADKIPKEKPEAVKKHEAEIPEGNVTTAAAASLAAAAVKAKVSMSISLV